MMEAKRTRLSKENEVDRTRLCGVRKQQQRIREKDV